MPLSDFVQINISLASVGLARAGFGVPLILTATATWAERVRFYSDIAGVANDFATTTPEYIAANLMFEQSQNGQLAQLAIGRCALPPTQQYSLAVQNVQNTTAYNIGLQTSTLGQSTVTYTSDASATTQEIHNGILTALNAVAGKNYTATFSPLVYTDHTFTVTVTNDLTITAHGLNTGDGPLQVTNSGGALPTGLTAVTNYWVVKVDANTVSLATSLANALAGTVVPVTIGGTGTNTLIHQTTQVSPILPLLVTGTAPGNWFSLQVLDASALASATAVTWWSIAQVHADPGLTTDLNNIQLETDSWYAVYHLYNSKACIEAISAWTEAEIKIFIADTSDSQCITGVVSDGDVMDALKGFSYDRTLIEYHPRPGSMCGAALQGNRLPVDPGGETWAFAQLVGVEPVSLSTTHRVNIRAKNGNSFEPLTSDANATWDGKTPGGEYLDTIRGLDSFRDDAQKSIGTALIANPKIPYTDPGIVILANELEGAVKRATDADIFTSDPLPKVIIPTAASQSSSDRSVRKFRGLKASAELAGAIQDVSVTVNVTQ